MKKQKTKTFDYWLTEEVQNTFGLKRFWEYPLLQEWLDADENIDEAENKNLEELKNKLFKKVDFWNEDDLKMKFIGPLLNLVDFEQDTYRTFFNVYLSATINGEKLRGKVDCMLAKGQQIPYQPFLFIHEYKKERGTDNDPLGQLLIAMVTAQSLNENFAQMIYGIYIIGRNWFFVVLNQKEFAVSDAFVATQEDIFKIFAILKKTKGIVEDCYS